MLTIDGYTITETLRENDRFVLQRAFRSCDGRPVLLKSPSSKHPSPETIRQLEHEWDIARALTPGFVLRPLALERRSDRLLLVLRQVEGQHTPVALDQLSGRG